MLRATAIGIAILLASSVAAAQTARPPIRPAVSVATPRPTFGQRLRGAVRGAILGFRLGDFRASALRRQTAAAGARARMLRLPDVRQANGYTCGTASLQSVLRYFGKGDDDGEEGLAGRLGTTPDNGTAPDAIVRVAREHGLSATMREGMTLDDLESYVQRGVPVIVDYQAWSEAPHPDYANDWDDGHYSVVVGIDRDHVYLEDPSILGARGSIPRNEFVARWHDQDGSRRYHQMGIVVESSERPRYLVRVGRTVPTL